MNLNATTVIAIVGVILCLTRKSKHRQNVCCLRENFTASQSVRLYQGEARFYKVPCQYYFQL